MNALGTYGPTPIGWAQAAAVAAVGVKQLSKIGAGGGGDSVSEPTGAAQYGTADLSSISDKTEFEGPAFSEGGALVRSLRELTTAVSGLTTAMMGSDGLVDSMTSFNFEFPQVLTRLIYAGGGGGATNRLVGSVGSRAFPVDDFPSGWNWNTAEGLDDTLLNLGFYKHSRPIVPIEPGGEWGDIYNFFEQSMMGVYEQVGGIATSLDIGDQLVEALSGVAFTWDLGIAKLLPYERLYSSS